MPEENVKVAVRVRPFISFLLVFASSYRWNGHLILNERDKPVNISVSFNIFIYVGFTIIARKYVYYLYEKSI